MRRAHRKSGIPFASVSGTALSPLWYEYFLCQQHTSVGGQDLHQIKSRLQRYACLLTAGPGGRYTDSREGRYADFTSHWRGPDVQHGAGDVNGREICIQGYLFHSGHHVRQIGAPITVRIAELHLVRPLFVIRIVVIPDLPPVRLRASAHNEVKTPATGGAIKAERILRLAVSSLTHLAVNPVAVV